jgi:hypothetical protein
LVDQEPPLDVALPAGGTIAELVGIDEALLGQRAQFLRPDSVLAIVTLSDENDCSIVDRGYGWLLARSMPMYRSTSVCQTNPNDPCCQSCAEPKPNANCAAPATDPACSSGTTFEIGSDEDDINLRCFDQRRRFGFDLLQPISRYTDGLTRQYQLDRAGNPVKNPIFAGGMRHPSQVIYTGIVGVPWQDLADSASLSGAGLTFLDAGELEAEDRWSVMLGDPEASPPVRPSDPFMLETRVDRATLSSLGDHPLLPGVRPVAAESTDPEANPINGHENVDVGGRDLQPACSFLLETPLTCDELANDAGDSCRCYQDDLPYNRAACQPPGGGAPGIIQYREVAYPAIRHLQLQRALGDTAVTASACPKLTNDAEDDYGYRPAMKALATRIQRALNP